MSKQGFVPGQFKGIGNAEIPGAKYPFLNTQPPGAYVLRVLDTRGFPTRKNGNGFAVDLEIVSGPEGAAPKVTTLTTSASDYYLQDIKAIVNAMLGGEFDDPKTGVTRPLEAGDIDEALMISLLTPNEHGVMPTVGIVVAADVFYKPKKEKPTETIGLAHFKPYKPTA